MKPDYAIYSALKTSCIPHPRTGAETA